MRLLLCLMPFILVLVGCASPKPTFYSFNATPIPQATPAAKSTRIMVGPVTLPAIYDRPQLVMKNANNTVQAYEYHRWASSLKGDIADVVSSNIAITLKISNVWSFSQSMQSNFDHQVFLDVQNIEIKAGEDVVVDVLWSIKPSNNLKNSAKPSASVNATTATNVIMGRSLVREPITDSGLNALVAAQSRAFSKVGQEIARSIP
jgi:uncharacterized lipoprotein YmbA